MGVLTSSPFKSCFRSKLLVLSKREDERPDNCEVVRLTDKALELIEVGPLGMPNFGRTMEGTLDAVFKGVKFTVVDEGMEGEGAKTGLRVG